MLTFEHLQFVDLLNAYRAEHQLAPVAIDVALQMAAEYKAAALAALDHFDHTEPSGRTAGQLRADFSYTNPIGGEIICFGPATAVDALRVWQESSPHNAMLLGKQYAAVGVGGPAEPTWDKPGDVFNAWAVEFGAVVLNPIGGEGGTPGGNPDREQRQAERARRLAERERRQRERMKRK